MRKFKELFILQFAIVNTKRNMFIALCSRELQIAILIIKRMLHIYFMNVVI